MRNTARIIAMMVLYNLDINKELDLSIPDVMIEKVNYDYNFMKEIVDGVVNNIDEIDYLISKNLKGYTLSRLSYVDRNLLRVGTYELLKTDTPINIIINEIVEISKEYSEIKGFISSKFNNAVLDKIAKEVNNGK